MPANTPAFRWAPSRLNRGPLTQVPSFTLVDESGAAVEVGAELENTGSVLLVPTSTLREGTTLTFQGAAICEEGAAVTVTFTVGPAATQGAGLGAPSLSPSSVDETFPTPTSSGSCTSSIRAAVATVAPPAGPWLQLLPCETVLKMLQAAAKVSRLTRCV